jgi:hypothetical protein
LQWKKQTGDNERGEIKEVGREVFETSTPAMSRLMRAMTAATAAATTAVVGGGSIITPTRPLIYLLLWTDK